VPEMVFVPGEFWMAHGSARVIVTSIVTSDRATKSKSPSLLRSASLR